MTIAGCLEALPYRPSAAAIQGLPPKLRSDYEFSECPTPAHSYSLVLDAPHYSHQDFAFKKAGCAADPKRCPWGDPCIGGGVREKITSSPVGGCPKHERRDASSDKQREAVNKMHAQNHHCHQAITTKMLLEPGDQDHGNWVKDIKNEIRSPSNPHWSHSALALQRRCHKVPIHETPRNAADVNRQTSTQMSYPEARSKVHQSDPGVHEHNSHAHMNLAKKRHTLDISGFCEPSYRSKYPAIQCPHPHYFSGPEPQHMAMHLYPEGPSVTARHYPDHFVCNVETDYHPYDRHPNGAKKSARPSSPRSSKAPEMEVWQGCVKYPVSQVVPRAANLRNRKTPRSDAESTGRSLAESIYHGSRGERWARDQPGRTPGPPDGYNYSTTPGVPPPFSTRSKSAGHVYRCHAQMQYDKGLCRAEAYRHSKHWEGIEAGSHGHSQDGSSWDSDARSEDPRFRKGSVEIKVGGKWELGKYSSRERLEAPRQQTARFTEAPTRAPSRDRVSKPRRSRSADLSQGTRRQSPRAVSSDRAPQ